MKQKELPKLKRSAGKRKITLYFDPEIDNIYRQGKQNGWDVSEIVRSAASEALKREADILSKPAEVA